MNKMCQHLDQVLVAATPATGCEECLRLGMRWVHLRRCLNCGHVGCCDASDGQHATKHFQKSGHAVMASAEPGESWRWCYIDHDFV
ncbi:UBP-type zinc finger domain-containing protein [Duganella aceris]|jgi:hypothetical protein|uniref:UBP-type zinc finger domain-containing protein n=1 Tax=Duganella aceris TaxID=2703883 RepID=A0ABX0FFD5_9BURK|nr:UBP-type zinc finger domain-containing protein [Duganella aceris]NGZ83262.1 UBP-type zinc finger domain-containing protein [Duganella aceris]